MNVVFLIVLVSCVALLAQLSYYTLEISPDSKQCLSSELKDGKLTITWKKTHANYYPEGTQYDYAVWRDVYFSSNGVVALEKTEVANYTPQKTITQPEKTEWPK